MGHGVRHADPPPQLGDRTHFAGLDQLDRSLTPMDLREWVKAVQVFPGRTNEFLPGDHATVKQPLQPPYGRGVWTLPLWVLTMRAT